MTDVYPMTSGKHFVNTLENNIISDSVQTEIPKKVWTSEPYHKDPNLVEWKYRKIKLWTNNVMNGSDAPSSC